MNLETDNLPTSGNNRQKQLRQIEHDIKTCLSVVSLGLQALPSVREEIDDFMEVCQTMEEDGVQPLKQMIANIVSIALQQLQEQGPHECTLPPSQKNSEARIGPSET